MYFVEHLSLQNNFTEKVILGQNPSGLGNHIEQTSSMYVQFTDTNSFVNKKKHFSCSKIYN